MACSLMLIQIMPKVHCVKCLDFLTIENSPISNWLAVIVYSKWGTNFLQTCKYSIELHSFRVHAIVMATTSEYFQNVLLKEESSCILEFIDSETLDDVIRFCYFGEIRLNLRNLEAIIIAAHELKMETLKLMCSDFLESTLDGDDSLRCALIAEKCELKASKELAQKFFAANCTKICELKEFHSWRECQFDDFVQNLWKNDRLFKNIMKRIQLNEHTTTTPLVFSKDLSQAIFKSFVSNTSWDMNLFSIN